MLPPLSTAATVAEKKKMEAAVGSSSVSYNKSPQPLSRPQHIYTPTSTASAPQQDTFRTNPITNIMRQTPNTTSSLISFQSAQTPTTIDSSRRVNHDHSFNIDQPLSPTSFVSKKHPPVERDRLGTFESVMAVRSLGSGHRHGQTHSNLAQQMLSVAAVEGRDAKSSPNDTASDVSSLSDDGTSSGAAAKGRAVKKSLLKKSRSIRKKNRSRPGSISGRQTSDQAPSIATSITSVTHTMETIDCSFPSPLTAEINVEKVKSSRDLMGNHRRSHSNMSGASFPLGNRSTMIHDSWFSPKPDYGETLAMQPEIGEDLIDVSSDAPTDPFSGLIGMPTSSISMCDNSFASGTTSSLEKPKASAFLRKPAMAKSKSSEFDPFAAVKSEIPRAPRYLTDNPLLSKSKYRGRLSSPLSHKRAPSLDTACMIGSIAMSETSAPVIPPIDSDSQVSILPPIPAQAPSSVTEEAVEEEEDDDDSSYASFNEELNRKDWGKGFVSDAINNFVDKLLPVVGLKPKETKLKRAEGCLT